MARRKAQIEEVPLELTPMIDVVFLLLIFFITTLKFKVLEGKLPTFLPKDVGVNASPIDELMEKLEIDIRPGGSTQGRKPGETYPVRIALNNSILPSMQVLYQQLVAAKRAQAEDLKVTLYPQQGVNYEQVVKVVDECVRAEITDITFAGVAFDA